MGLDYGFDTTRMINICREHDVDFIGLFGSTARGEDRPDSDIDLLVKFSKRKSLYSLVRLERELTAALGRKVDVLTDGSISPYLRKTILGDLKVLYDAS